jgi:hypothetical protein
MHSIDLVFRPNDSLDTRRSEPISLKKLDKGDASWKTQHTILGWDIDTEKKTISLPPHRLTRLQEILADIPRKQRRIGVSKWHKVLGELRSMSIALPGSRGLFSHLQTALKHRQGGRVTLTQEVHQAIDDFRWILRNLAERPTRIAELVPLLPLALGYHDASGADDASRLFHLTNNEFLAYFHSHHGQDKSFQLATPTPSLLLAVTSALRRKPYNVESLRAEMPAPTPTGAPDASTQLHWASTPFSKPSKTKYQSYKSSSSEYVKAHLHATAVPFSLERLKITYGALAKRSSCWATRIHG